MEELRRQRQQVEAAVGMVRRPEQEEHCQEQDQEPGSEQGLDWLLELQEPGSGQGLDWLQGLLERPQASVQW